MGTSNKARKAEATGEPLTFEWRGDTYEIPSNPDDWTLDMLESLEEGKSIGICRGALGPAQWRRIRSMNLKASDVNELMGEITKVLGFKSAGESEAS